MSDEHDHIADLKRARDALRGERALLVQRIKEIDDALGEKPARTRGASEAVLEFVSEHPGCSTNEVISSLTSEDMPAQRIRGALTSLSASGRIRSDGPHGGKKHAKAPPR